MSKYKHIETGYHKAAKEILSDWIGGILEYPLTVRNEFIIVPDVVCIRDGVLVAAYIYADCYIINPFKDDN